MQGRAFVRHQGASPGQRSACGRRDRLISHEDRALQPAAWAHAVEIDQAKPHYHRRATELYYVLEGEGVVFLDGVEHPVREGSIVHIPPGVVHGAEAGCASWWWASPTSPTTITSRCRPRHGPQPAVR